MFLALTQDVPINHVVPLQQYNNRVSLVNTGTYSLLSNICPHQGSRIAKCKTDNLQCPYHGLRFDSTGNGIGNDFFLESWPTYRNQTILFDQHVSCLFPIDTQFMSLTEQRCDIVNATPNVIMDVFLDIDHISVAHAGVYDKIGLTDIEVTWSTFENGSVQYVPLPDNIEILQTDRQYNLGACWMAVYPGTMIEWQPGALFVTLAHSIDEKTSKVQVYKYKDLRYWEEAWALNNSVWEEAWAQDKELAEMIAEFTSDNLPGLKQHYRNWIQDAMSQ